MQSKKAVLALATGKQAATKANKKAIAIVLTYILLRTSDSYMGVLSDGHDQQELSSDLDDLDKSKTGSVRSVAG